MAIPNSYTFSLSQVRTELQLTGTTCMCLSGVLNEAPNVSFDSTFEGSKNCLRSFRNYELIVDYSNYVTTIPWRMAFDGTNMWVQNSGNDIVNKIIPSGGISTYSVSSVGTGLNDIVYDGTNMWLPAKGTGSSKCLIKVTPDGSATGYTTPQVPWRIAFDGTNIWLLNLPGNATIISPTSGSEITTYAIGAGMFPGGIVFDGTNMWVSSRTPSMIKVTPAGATTSYSATYYMNEMTYLSGNIWGILATGSTLVKVGSDGSWTTYPGLGTCFSHITNDGTNLWVTQCAGTSPSTGYISKISTSGTLLRRYAAGDNPVPIAYDNVNGWMWFFRFTAANTQFISKIGAV